MGRHCQQMMSGDSSVRFVTHSYRSLPFSLSPFLPFSLSPFLPPSLPPSLLLQPRVLTSVRPPNVAPQPLPIVHKLRSATVATDEFSSSLDFTSSTEQSLSDSSEVEKKALSASMEDRRPPPNSKPVTGKAKGPPPPKPKPFLGTGQLATRLCVHTRCGHMTFSICACWGHMTSSICACWGHMTPVFVHVGVT